MIAIARNVFYDNDPSSMEEDFLIEDLDVIDKEHYSDHVKYVFRVFEDHHPDIYKKCVIYYVLLDYHNNNFSQKDLIETVFIARKINI